MRRQNGSKGKEITCLRRTIKAPPVSGNAASSFPCLDQQFHIEPGSNCSPICKTRLIVHLESDGHVATESALMSYCVLGRRQEGMRWLKGIDNAGTIMHSDDSRDRPLERGSLAIG